MLRGDELLRSGQAVSAVAEYEKALAGDAAAVAALRLAIVYEAIGRWDKVERYLQQAQAKLPNPSLLELDLARARAGLGKRPEAWAQTLRIADAEPTRLEPLLLLAAFAGSREEVELSARKLERWHEGDANRAVHNKRASAESLLGLSAVYERLGRPDDLARTLERAKTAPLNDAGMAARAGSALLMTGQAVAAERMLSAALAATKGDPQIAHTLVRASVAARHPELALSTADSIAQRSRREPEWSMLRAEAQLGLGKAADAVATLRSLLAGRLAKDKPDARAPAESLLARALLANDDPRAAEGVLLASIAAAPSAATAARLSLAELYLSRGEHAKAVELLRALTTERPDLERAQTMLGSALLAGSDPVAAHEVFARLARSKPQDPLRRLPVASALEAQGKLDAARAELEAGLELAPADPALLRAWIGVLERQGKLADGLAPVERATAAKPSAAIHELHGNVLRALRRFEEAEAAYHRAIDAAPQATSPWMKLGDLHSQQGARARALSLYGEVLKRDPKRVDAAMASAQLELQGGDRAGAILRYEAILSHASSYVPALNNLAFLLAELPEQRARALALAERAHALAPKSDDITDTLAFVHLQRGEAEKALALLEPIAKVQSAGAGVHYHLGLALLATGRKTEAKAALSRAAALAKDDPSLADSIAKARRGL